MLRRYLDELEDRIDEAVESDLLGQWRTFASGQWPQEVFRPRRPAPLPPKLTWTKPTIAESLNDYEAMALQQFFYGGSEKLAGGGGSLLMVRCNYGIPIMPTLFGARLHVMEDRYDTLPTALALPGGLEDVRRLLDRGPVSLDQPYAQKVFEMGRRFKAIMKDYPKISRHLFIVHPDLQGPLDNAEVLLNNELFTAFYDEPDLINAFLKLLTDTYLSFFRRWEQVCPPFDPDFAVHWGALHRGRIMLRNDSAMNLSGQMYEEFVAPCDQRLLDELGGGGCHACGKVDHYIDRLARLRGLHAFNFSQPQYNQVETILRHTLDRGLCLFGIPADTVATLTAQGRPLRGLMQTT